MTHDANVPGTSLPKFTVNPVPTDRITSEHLSVLLERYRRGEDEPLIFGDGSRPEAAVIPFEVFVRLKMYDHAVSVREREEDAFQAEISDRVRAAAAARASGEGSPNLTLDELAANLDEPAGSMLRKQLDDD